MTQTFRIAVLVNFGIHVVGRLIPLAFWDNAPYSELLKFDGYGARLMLVHRIYEWAPLVILSVATLGLSFFQNWGRFVFLGLWLFTWLGALLFGVRVIPPVIGFLGYLSGSLTGFILIAAFLTPLRQ